MNKGNKMNSYNIVKKVCKELGITQKELAERLGVDDGTVRKWSSSGKTPTWAINFINCLIEKKECEEKLQKFKTAFKLIEEAKK